MVSGLWQTVDKDLKIYIPQSQIRQRVRHARSNLFLELSTLKIYGFKRAVRPLFNQSIFKTHKSFAKRHYSTFD